MNGTQMKEKKPLEVIQFYVVEEVVPVSLEWQIFVNQTKVSLLKNSNLFDKEMTLRSSRVFPVPEQGWNKPCSSW